MDNGISTRNVQFADDENCNASLYHRTKRPGNATCDITWMSSVNPVAESVARQRLAKTFPRHRNRLSLDLASHDAGGPPGRSRFLPAPNPGAFDRSSWADPCAAASVKAGRDAINVSQFARSC